MQQQVWFHLYKHIQMGSLEETQSKVSYGMMTTWGTRAGAGVVGCAALALGNALRSSPQGARQGPSPPENPPGVPSPYEGDRPRFPPPPAIQGGQQSPWYNGPRPPPPAFYAPGVPLTGTQDGMYLPGDPRWYPGESVQSNGAQAPVMGGGDPPLDYRSSARQTSSRSSPQRLAAQGVALPPYLGLEGSTVPSGEPGGVESAGASGSFGNGAWPRANGTPEPGGYRTGARDAGRNAVVGVQPPGASVGAGSLDTQERPKPRMIRIRKSRAKQDAAASASQDAGSRSAATRDDAAEVPSDRGGPVGQAVPGTAGIALPAGGRYSPLSPMSPCCLHGVLMVSSMSPRCPHYVPYCPQRVHSVSPACLQLCFQCPLCPTLSPRCATVIPLSPRCPTVSRDSGYQERPRPWRTWDEPPSVSGSLPRLPGCCCLLKSSRTRAQRSRRRPRRCS